MTSLLGLCVVVISTAQENRTIDGSGNNQAYDEWGMAGTNLKYHMGNAYADGISRHLPVQTVPMSGRSPIRSLINLNSSRAI